MYLEIISAVLDVLNYSGSICAVLGGFEVLRNYVYSARLLELLMMYMYSARCVRST